MVDSRGTHGSRLREVAAQFVGTDQVRHLSGFWVEEMAMWGATYMGISIAYGLTMGLKW